MLRTFQDILAKYFKRNRKHLFSNNVTHAMNGAVLVKTGTELFDVNGTMIDEVTEYCNQQGYCPDKIVFVYSYDIEVTDDSTARRSMSSDSKINIIEEEGKVIARVCIGEWVALE